MNTAKLIAANIAGAIVGGFLGSLVLLPVVAVVTGGSVQFGRVGNTQQPTRIMQ